MTLRPLGGRALALLLLASLCTLPLGACNTAPKPATHDATVRRDPPPSFADAALAYNDRIARLDRLFARANLRVTYFDEDGQRRTEDPEGRLQIIRPDRLALSLGKAGQTLFWFGCDSEHYWWLDLSESKRRIAAVGRHERFEESASRRIGLAVRPLDLIRVLGITPLDPRGRGGTQWSRDGALLGITTPIAGRVGAPGFQRIWVDPRTYMPRTIEIFDAGKTLVLLAEHEGSEPVEQSSGAQRDPRISGRITATHFESGTDIRLTLTGAKDSGISDKAFDLDVLLKTYEIDKVIDLDSRTRVPPARPAAALP